MRLYFLRHTFIALIVLLIVNLPAVTVAQQNSVNPEAQAAIARDTEAMQLVAKVAAEQDATRDVNQLLWFGSGLGAAAIGSGIGVCGGCVAGLATNPPEFDPVICLLPDVNVKGVFDGTAVGVGLGCIVGSFVPLMGIYNYRSNPPPKRLLGKSAEYVDAYTDAYIRKTRSIRTRSAATGVATCFGISLLSYLVFEDL